MKPFFHTRAFFVIVLAIVSAATAQDSTATDATGGRRRDKVEKMYYEYKTEAFQDVDDLTVDKLRARLRDGGVVILDVREKKEREVSMIPGAISEEEFKKKKRQYKDSTVVVYCTIGYRSGVYAQELTRKGYTAYNLVGGVLAWAHAGGQFVHDGSPTMKIHVYGKEWDLAPLEYESTW
jgi:rhodanese-related sulfurtransferase